MRTCIFIFLLCLITTFIQAKETDTAESLLGERLFLETRLSQYFAAHVKKIGNVNSSLEKGDPALYKTARFFGLPPYQIPFADGPYAGKSFNCRACHLVDEHMEQTELGMRSFSDFASRSPLPTRSDNKLTTVRNSPALVDASLARDNFLMHFDGEFSSLDQLVRGTLTGRNMGWLPGEKQEAIQHICTLIREDDGSDALAEEYGSYSYLEVFSGEKIDKKRVEKKFLLPENVRIDPKNETCENIFASTAHLISAYLKSLSFAQSGQSISPYDYFLKLNDLPTEARNSETSKEYSENLIKQVEQLALENKLKFVTKNPSTGDEKFLFHDQPYEFGEKQLTGMRIFFSLPEKDKTSIGNCVACHPAPHFTDFSLHNIGITQVEYDAIHGQDAFNNLKIPNIKQRNKQADLYLPANQKHPHRKGIFRRIPSQTNVMATDLGAWNIFFNSDYPLPQESIYNAICISNKIEICTSRDDALNRSIAAFKTPSLRNLGHSAPYMHNGQISDLHAVISFYLAVSINTRQGLFRNPDDDIANINIKPKDILPLAAFLISLYEDYASPTH